jgi:hypothetical protein
VQVSALSPGRRLVSDDPLTLEFNVRTYPSEYRIKEKVPGLSGLFATCYQGADVHRRRESTPEPPGGCLLTSCGRSRYERSCDYEDCELESEAHYSEYPRRTVSGRLLGLFRHAECVVEAVSVDAGRRVMLKPCACYVVLAVAAAV